MTTGDSSAATKQDLSAAENRLMGHIKATEDLLRGNIKETEDRLMGHMKTMQTDLMHYFDLKNEQLTGDFRDIFQDQTSVHTDRLDAHEARLVRVEHKVGLAI